MNEELTNTYSVFEDSLLDAYLDCMTQDELEQMSYMLDDIAC